MNKVNEVGVANETMFVLTGKFITAKHGGVSDMTLWSAVGQFPAEGQPASVEFDINSVIEYQKKFGDVIGFYHTHPCEAYTSLTDIITMNGLVDSFGKPLLCLIEGTNGLLTWYWLGDSRFKQGNSYRWNEKFWGYIESNE